MIFWKWVISTHEWSETYISSNGIMIFLKYKNRNSLKKTRSTLKCLSIFIYFLNYWLLLNIQQIKGENVNKMRLWILCFTFWNPAHTKFTVSTLVLFLSGTRRSKKIPIGFCHGLAMSNIGHIIKAYLVSHWNGGA